MPTKKKSYLYKKIRNFVKPPLFSIITVVKNNKKMLQKCFLSVDKLKLRDFEHIIVDGLSSDGTIDLIKKNKNAKNKFIIEKDEGIYDAMNKGILVATGKYIGILNSDDQYTPEALNIIKKYIKKYNSPDFIFGSVIKGRLIMSGFHPKKIFYKFNIFPSHSGSFFIKKTSQDKIGYYNTKFKYSSDYDLIFRLIKKKFIGVSTDHLEITANFFTKGISSKISFLKKINEECRIRLENKQNILFVFFLFLLQIFNKIRNVFFNKKIKRSF